MKLTAKNVDQILMDCFFRDDEDKSQAVIVEGIMARFGFHPHRLTSHRKEIGELLAELPDDFHQDKGGGMSFFNACMTRDGEQWGEHVNIEQLLVLGIATGQAKTCLPRELWGVFPGGMPYFVVLKPKVQAGQ